MSEFESEMVAIRDIHPNPYRELATYGLIESKLDELVESINDTGFWPNVIGRRNAFGQVEIAYGHHRLEACRRVFGEDHMLPVHIQRIDDHRMLQIMAAENSDDWANPAQHVRMCVTAAIRELEKELDKGSYSLVPEGSAKDAFGAAYAYDDADKYGVHQDMVARYLGGAWLSGRGEGPRRACKRIQSVWPLINRTERMRRGLKLKMEQAQRKATVEATRARVAPRADTREKAQVQAERAERTYQKLQMEEAHDDKWDDKTLDQFSSAQLASQFKNLMLDTEEGRELLESLGGNWEMALNSIDSVLIARDGTGLSRDDRGQINASDLRKKVTQAVGATLDNVLESGESEEDSAIAYEMMKRLTVARENATATVNSVNRCATWAEENKLTQRAAMHYQVLMTELKKVEGAARRLESVVNGIDFGDAIGGNVIEGEIIQ